ncbi:MAG: 26S protease regulatory subunit [Planctomycetes bacterium]|nr:26S protease regulatory subunit [Planctomycetota bacterium]
MAQKRKKRVKREPSLLKRLRTHFGTEPAELPVVEQHFDVYERPNLHLAILELIEEPGRNAELVGIVLADDYRTATLARLSRAATAKSFDEGPVEYADEALPNEQQLACVKHGAWFFHEQGEPIVLLLTRVLHSYPPQITTSVMAGSREVAERFLRRLTRLTRYAKAHRGHVLSLEEGCHGDTTLKFHCLPSIGRDEIILPEALLRRIERHTLSFSRHAERLRAAGRHLKRGILLHGPPGTGKTLSAMYLAAQMPGRTVLLLTGAGMRVIEHACRLARVLEPATVILEDVDLIGTEREHQTIGANALLFELLNQMDGLADDVDILFVLTTNRPDILEPALASRPGRIDQAIEVPLPDADCRRRLLQLYARGLRLELSDFEELVRRTEGVSGAFIRELLRKAAVFAAEEDGAGETLVVRDPHVEEALTELLVAGGVLTQSLLGASRGAAPSSA